MLTRRRVEGKAKGVSIGLDWYLCASACGETALFVEENGKLRAKDSITGNHDMELQVNFIHCFIKN